MTTDQYSKIVFDWLNDKRDLDGIKNVVDSGNTADLLNSVRRQAEDAKSREDIKLLIDLFSIILETTASVSENPLMAGDLYLVSVRTRQRMHVESSDLIDGIANAALTSLDPVATEYLLSLGLEQIPKDVVGGVMRYVANSHPDPKIRKKYVEMLKDFKEEANVMKDLLDTLESAEIASEEAGKAADKLFENIPETATDEERNAFAMKVTNAGFMQKALDFLEARLETEGLTDEQKSLLFAGMADVAMVQDPPIALAYYEKAMEMHPKNIRALVGIAKVHKAEKRWDDAMSVLRKGIAMTAGKPEEAIVLMGLADVLWALEQWDQAEKYVRRVRALEPQNKQAIIFYENYYKVKEDWQRLYSTLQFHLSLEKDPAERLRITKQLSTIAMDNMGNQDKAAEVLKKLVLMDPSDEKSLERLVRIYEDTGKWRALVEIYNDVVRKLPSSEIEKKIQLLKSVAGIYQDEDKINNPNMVLTTYGRIIQLDPENVEVLKKLAVGYESSGNWSDLLIVLKQELESVKDKDEQLMLCRKIVEIGLEKLSNENVVLPYMERIFEIDPQDADVLIHLVNVYEHKRKYEKLMDVLRQLLPVIGPERREEMLYKAAVTAKERLGKNYDALDYYEELYNINKKLRDVRMMLHELYPKLGEWERYAKFLEEEVKYPMPDHRKVELLGKLGEIKIDRLDDAEGARRMFEMAINIQPHDVLSQRRLEEIYIKQGDFQALKERLEKDGRLRDYVNILSERELREEDTERQVDLALEMARTCEQDINEMDRAIRYYDRAYALNPMLTDAGQKLVKYYEQHKQTKKEIETLTRMADHVEDMAIEKDAREHLFKLLRKERRFEGAFEQGAKAIELAVSMGEASELLNAFSEVVKAVNKWSLYADLLMGVVAVSNPERKVELLLEIAKIYRDRLGDPDMASSTLMGVLDVDPKHPEVLNMLEELAIQTEDFKELEKIYQHQIEVQESESVKSEIYLKLGGLYEDFLSDYEAAVGAYARVAEQNPKNRLALAGLHRCYERMEQYPDLVSVLKMEVDSEQNTLQKNRLRLELAKVFAEQLGDLNNTVDLAEQALSEDPSNKIALQLLMDLHNNPETRPILSDRLPGLLEKLELWVPLETVLLEQADDSKSPAERAKLFEQVARLRYDKFDNPDGALDILLLSVRALPTDKTVAWLSELGQQTDRDDEVARALQLWINTGENAHTPDIKLDNQTEQLLTLQLASICEVRLNDPSAAITCYESVTTIAGDSAEVLRKLADLYRKQNDNKGLMITLNRLLKVIPVAQSRDVVAELVDLTMAENDYETVIPVLKNYVYEVPEDTELAIRLEEIYEQNDDKDALYEYLTWLQDKLPDENKKTDNLYKLAVLQLEHLSDYASVITTIQQALELEPLREDVLELCERIAFGNNEDWQISMGSEVLEILVDAFKKPGRKEDLAKALLKSAELETNEKKRLDFLSEAGKTLESLGKKEQAFNTYRTIFEADPGLSDIGNRLVDLGGELGKSDELVRVMRTAAGNAEPDIRLDLQIKAARLLLQTPEKMGEAETLLQQLYEEAPENAEVLDLYLAFLKAEKTSKDIVDFLNKVIKTLNDNETKRIMQKALADTLEETGDSRAALDVYEAVIQSRPDTDAMDELTRSALDASILSCEEMGNDEKLLELNFLAGNLEADKDEQIKRFYAATRVTWDEKLKDRIVEIYRKLLILLPDSNEIGIEARQAMVRAGMAEEAMKMLAESIEKGTTTGNLQDLKKELARLYIEELQSPEKAIHVLKEVLLADPDDNESIELITKVASIDSSRLSALRLLSKVYKAQKNWSQLTLNTLFLIDLMDSKPELKTEILELIETFKEAGSTDEAIEVLVACLRRTGCEDPTLSMLGALLADTDRLEDLSGLLAGIADSVDDPAYGALLRTKGGEYLIEKGKPEGAKDLYRLQVEAFPDDRDSLEKLRTLYQKLNEPDGLVFVIGLLADIEGNDDTRKSLLIEGGEIARDRLEDMDLAETYFLRIFEIDPASWEAFSALEILYRTKKDFDALYGLHLREFESLVNKDVNGTWKESGLLLINEALDRSDIQTASDTAISLMESGEIGSECIVAAKMVLFAQEEQQTLFGLLEKTMQDAEDDNGLLDLYRTSLAKGLKWPPRPDVLRKAIDLEEKIGNKELLWEDMLVLANETSENMELWLRLRELGRELKRMDNLTAVLKSFVEGESASDSREPLMLLLADILQKDLKDMENAEYYLRALLQQNPESAQAFSMLKGLLMETERFVELGILYESSADSSQEPKEKHEKYIEAAKIFKETGDTEHSMELLEKCIVVGWDVIQAADLLKDIAQEAKSDKYLVKAILAHFDLSDDPEKRIDLGLQISALYTSMNKPENAIDILNRLAQETGYANADIIHSMERIYIDLERFSELAELYISSASSVSEQDKRLDYRKKAAQLYEVRLGQADKAINLLKQVLDESPEDNYAYSRLIELLKADKRDKDVENLYRFRLGLNIHKNERIEILTDFAIAMHQQKRWEEALDRADQGLRVKPENNKLIDLVEDIAKQNTRFSLRAYDILEDVYRRKNRYEDLVRILKGKLILEKDNESKRSVLMELAGIIFVKMNDPEHALGFLAQALRLRIDDKAISLLDEIGGVIKDMAQYYGVIQDVLNKVDDIDLAIKLHKQSARLALDFLSDPASAADHYMACLDNDKLDIREMENLERLLNGLNRYREEVTVLREIIRIKGYSETLEYVLKLGDIYLEKLHDPEGAFEEYSAALHSMGRIESIEKRLFGLIHDPIVGTRAVDILKPLAKEDLNFNMMIELITARIDNTPDKESQSDMFCELAEIYDRMGERQSELKALGEALIRKPRSESVARDIVNLAEVTDGIETAVKYLEHAADKSKWVDVKKTLYLKISRLASNNPKLSSKLENTLTRVLQIDPDNTEAIQKLEKFYQSNNMTNKYIKLLELKLNSESFFEDRDRDLKKLADLYLERGSPEDAAVVLRKALKNHPMDVEVLSRLMDIEESTGNREGGIFVVNQIMLLPADCRGCAELLRRAAKFILFKIGDKSLARNVYEKLWRYNPQDNEVKEQLISILKEDDDWHALFNIYDMVSDRGKGDEAVEAAMAGAELAETRMHNTEQAIRMYMRALGHDANKEEAIDELIRLYYEAGYWSELIHILRRKAKITSVDTEREGLLLQAVDLAREKLDDEGLATEILKELLEYNPENISAMLLLARQLYHFRDLNGSEALYKKILELEISEEDRLAVLTGLLNIYSDMKVNPEKVIELARQVLQINPFEKRAIELLKKSYISAGNHEKLVKLLESYYDHVSDVKERSETALEIAKIYLNIIKDEDVFLRWIDAAYNAMPENSEVVKTLVDYHKSKGELSKARPHLEWLIKHLDKTRDRENFVIYSKDMGMLLEEIGENEEALELYIKIFKSFGGDIDLRLRIGILQSKLGKLKDTIKTLQPLLLKLSSMSADFRRKVLLTLAEAHSGLGERHKMRQYILRLLTEDPNDKEAEAFLNR